MPITKDELEGSTQTSSLSIAMITIVMRNIKSINATPTRITQSTIYSLLIKTSTTGSMGTSFQFTSKSQERKFHFHKKKKKKTFGLSELIIFRNAIHNNNFGKIFLTVCDISLPLHKKFNLETFT